ncbi:2'-5' RNA ligase [Andreprevotia lacus DSM 23236]|jgi:2'-5' RNA ligase|uniref:RNA 2',3'-cyclic phosphodiesterase n=1 Tax=Andreprevotia lacus DSM 23236 TaxID=1121001 RepID=A0A1W1XGN0_9NEIS|nr:RNA 2',3'-cyclic phosphodiesterase [Andreprevotia lacus]SMC23143.1 2'-5' RNA ligase [Andreprevotia lacus DSM 23236]
MRLFVGLPLPAGVAHAVASVRDEMHASMGGKPSTTANLHLTLAFLGEGNVQMVQQLRQLLAALPTAAFEITLDVLGDFKRGQIVWLGSQQPHAALLQLAEALRMALDAAGIVYDPQPFAPHVTLLRKGQPIRAALLQAIHWPVSELALYVSESSPDGVQYRPLYQRSLTA